MANEQVIAEIKTSIARLNSKARYVEEFDAVLKGKLGYAAIEKRLHLIPDDGARYRLEELECKLDKFASERVNVPIKNDSFIRIQKDYKLVNEEHAKESDSAALIGVSAGERLRLPIYVYFFNRGNEDNEDATKRIETIMANRYPKFKLALEIEARQIGNQLLGEDFKDDRVMTYVCPLEEAEPFIEHLKKCYAENHPPVMTSLLGFDFIYKGGEPNAATHQQD